MIHVPTLEIVAEVSQIILSSKPLACDHGDFLHTNTTWQVTNFISINFTWRSRHFAAQCMLGHRSLKCTPITCHVERGLKKLKIVSLYADVSHVSQVSHARTNSVWPEKILQSFYKFLPTFQWSGSNMSYLGMSVEDKFVTAASVFSNKFLPEEGHRYFRATSRSTKAVQTELPVNWVTVNWVLNWVFSRVVQSL